MKGQSVNSSVATQNGRIYQIFDGIQVSPNSKKKNSPLSNIKPLSPSQFSKSTRKALLMGVGSGVGPFKMENNSDSHMLSDAAGTISKIVLRHD